MNDDHLVTIDELASKVASYFPDANLDLVKKAYAFANDKHEKQKRASGDPYIIHPTQVALILTEMKLDMDSIVCGLLHDTVEDTGASLQEIEKEFSPEIAELVDGVTKLNKIQFKTTEEKQAENFRKMIIAMAKDIRVILVKLADRLNNMRTLSYLPMFKQKVIAQETMEIYAPIANRLGISWLKIELEDLCLRYLHPDVYYKLAQKVAKTKKEREKYIEEVCQILTEKLRDYGIQSQVSGRAKHFYSIYKKMQRRGLDYDQVHDIIAFRIIVENITECYKALGVIHAMYKPVPGRIKDYIAMPKANSYQSLHTTLIGPYGERVEIQIRTEEMHLVAERGISAHWKYKEGRFGSKTKENVEWVNRLMEWQKDLLDPNEFLETVKIDLFAEDVFVFTPQGEVRQLPHGATPIDFAYSIHTDVGHRCIGAKVNGKIVPLKHRLKSGDTIEILTSSTQNPSKDWLKIAKTSRAKAKIRVFIKQQERDRAGEVGKDLLEKGLKKFDRSLNKVEKSGTLSKVTQELGFKTPLEMYISLGYGRTLPHAVISKIVPKEELEKGTNDVPEEESFLSKVFRYAAKKRTEAKNAVMVANMDDVLIRFGKCCNPLPGDSIVGFITRGRGVTIHASNCSRALDSDTERRVDVQWNIQHQGKTLHQVKIRVLAVDEPGVLASLSQVVSAAGVNITQANIRTTRDKKAICQFDLEVSDSVQLERILRTIESKKNVISVQRTRN